MYPVVNKTRFHAVELVLVCVVAQPNSGEISDLAAIDVDYGEVVHRLGLALWTLLRFAHVDSLYLVFLALGDARSGPVLTTSHCRQGYTESYIRREREQEMRMVDRYHLEPQTGRGFIVVKGQTLRVIDPLGEQVADLVCFSRDDPREWLSNGRTFDYNSTIYVTTGHALYSNRSNPMFTIVQDRVGVHDFLYAPCSPDTFRILYEHQGHHPSCLSNLAVNLDQYGIAADDIPATFNIFMNGRVLPSGEMRLAAPLSRPGDFIDLRAHMDMIVGLTACSAELSNGGTFKPIHAEVFQN